MREYRYNAVTSTGQTVTGVRRAQSAELLAGELLQQGLVLLNSRPTLGSFGQLFSTSGRAGRKELSDFTQHLSTCFSAGIPLATALGDFRDQTKGAFAHVVADILNDVQSGTSLDEAFARHPEVFDSVYLAMVASGSATGRLDETFDELVAYMEWNENLRSQTSQAMVYPSILVVGVVGLFLLLLLFVIPRFSGMFADADFELPALTRAVMGAGDFLGRWWWLLLIGLGGTAVVGRFYFRTESGRYRRDRIQLALPVLGTFQRKLALSRFSKSFALIFASGLDLLRLLKLLEGVVGNEVMARQLRRVRERAASGESLSAAFREADLFPPLVQRLVSVGEKTGTLDASLLKASRQYDREIPHDLKKALSVFETIIIVVLAVLVCVAALALLMPVMQIRSGIV